MDLPRNGITSVTVGDHANHIAEQVIFVAEGRDVRYLSPEVLENLERK